MSKKLLLSDMDEDFTPFSWGRDLAMSEYTEASWRAWANIWEEQGDAYNAEECRKAARKAAAARAAKEAKDKPETDAIDFRFRAPPQGESSKKGADGQDKAPQA